MIVGEEENSCIGDFIADPLQDLDKNLDTLVSQEWLRQLLVDFSEQEQVVIVRRYLISEPENYREIGKQLNVSHERVRQIHEKALRKLRVRLSKDKPQEVRSVSSYL
jgi:RNA polymerase sigma factor (sigma-70 family)